MIDFLLNLLKGYILLFIWVYFIEFVGSLALAKDTMIDFLLNLLKGFTCLSIWSSFIELVVRWLFPSLPFNVFKACFILTSFIELLDRWLSPNLPFDIFKTCIKCWPGQSKPLTMWEDALLYESCTTEMVCWALTNKESYYFLSEDVFRFEPKMTEEKEVWECLLSVEINREACQSDEEYKTQLNRLSRLFRLLAPRFLLDRDYMKRLCKKHTFGALLLDESMNTDIIFLMELKQQNEGLVECSTFLRNYQFATILEAWRQTIWWREAHVNGNFDPALWRSIQEFIAFPEGINSSQISRYVTVVPEPPSASFISIGGQLAS